MICVYLLWTFHIVLYSICIRLYDSALAIILLKATWLDLILWSLHKNSAISFSNTNEFHIIKTATNEHSLFVLKWIQGWTNSKTELLSPKNTGHFHMSITI